MSEIKKTDKNIWYSKYQIFQPKKIKLKRSKLSVKLTSQAAWPNG